MTCAWYDLGCTAVTIANGATGTAATSTTSSAANAVWDVMGTAFAGGAAALLKSFGNWFGAMPDLNLEAAGIAGPYAISFVIGSAVAALLIFGQVIRTLWTRDGTGIAQALTGTAKAVLAWLMTGTVATAALAASDEIARFIVTAEFGSQAGFARKLGAVVNWSGIGNPLEQAASAGALLLVIGLIGILLVVALWFELLLRNAAIAILIAVSPIAAAGQVSDTTKTWWSRTVSATVQLIILKPVIALVFAVGFGMAGDSAGVTGILQGLLVLGLAAFAWPVIARFFTFATIQAADSGLGALLGFAAGTLASRGGGSGTAGVPPDQLGRDTEARVMGPTGESSGATGGGGGGTVAAGIGFALQKLHQAGTFLAGRMEQTAAHGGMPGAYPYSTISGGQRIAPPRRGGGMPGGSAPSGASGPGTAEDYDAGEWPWDEPDYDDYGEDA
jgi:hypothetical protein